MKKTTKIGKAALTALVLFAFAVYYYVMIMGFLPKPFSYSLHDLHYPLFNVLCSVLPATVMIIAHRHGFLRAWGLGSRILRGFCYALLCVLPMLVYSAAVSKWNSDSGIFFVRTIVQIRKMGLCSRLPDSRFDFRSWASVSRFKHFGSYAFGCGNDARQCVFLLGVC